jgi:uncharacterized protein (DUF58 family)
VTSPGGLVPAAREAAARPFGRLGAGVGGRTIALLVVGLGWLAPAFVDARFVVAMLAWDAAVMVLWAADLWRLPAPRHIVVRRTWRGAPALSVTSGVEIAFESVAGTGIRVRAIDTVPARLRESPPAIAVDLPARGEAAAGYDIRPARRGPAHVGAVHLRYRSGLGLAERWAAADLEQPVLVYPNLEEARRSAMYLIRSRQVELEKRSSRQRGTGRAFESLREYRQGDDIRDVCWTATARRARLVTRVFEVERSQTVWLVLDAGRLMRARVDGLSKLDYSVTAALALAQVAVNGGDRVGVMSYGRRVVQRAPAAHGSAHVRRLVDQLASVEEEDVEADHLMAAGRLLADQKRRSLVVWITDLAETTLTPDVVRAASHLLERHVVVLVVIGEPDLRALSMRTPASVAEMYDVAAAQDVLQRRERVLALVRERGAMAIEATSGGLALTLVNAYLDVKQRNRL